MSVAVTRAHEHGGSGENQLALRPLSRALGAEFSGGGLVHPLDDATFARIRGALNESDGLVVMHDMQMTPVQHIELARRFGPIERHAADGFAHPDHADVLVVSNIMKKGRPIGAIYAGQYWHSDMSYVSKPPMQSLLYALEIPPIGGDTMFTNMYRAYEALSEPMKRLLGGLEAVHDYSHAYDTFFNTRKERPPLTPELRAKVPPVRHPVVRTHPVTGRKSLYISPGFTTGFAGMPREESRPILEFLFRHAVRPEFVYRHRWQVRDLVIWDNACTLHLAIADYDLSTARRLHRVTVAGDAPVQHEREPATEWIRLCPSADIAEGSATVLCAGGVEMLVIRRQGHCLAVPPVCAHMADALAKGQFTGCFDGNAPKCNQHLAGARADVENDESPGMVQSPVLQYETKEVSGVLYVNPARQRLSDLQYVTCSPLGRPDGDPVLRINLWSSEEGESVESVSGRARSAAQAGKP